MHHFTLSSRNPLPHMPHPSIQRYKSQYAKSLSRAESTKEGVRRTIITTKEIPSLTKNPSYSQCTFQDVYCRERGILVVPNAVCGQLLNVQREKLLFLPSFEIMVDVHSTHKEIGQILGRTRTLCPIVESMSNALGLTNFGCS